MLNPSCLFCKIIQKTIKSTIIQENDWIIAIQDIAPKAPTHYLLLPKKHVENVLYLTDEDEVYSWQMMKMARDLGKQLPSQNFNMISNNGAGAGQSVFHWHIHFLAGRNLYEHGLKL
jgi:diadenosine tetraphosphate (Ap4A) HIT family hydrolase